MYRTIRNQRNYRKQDIKIGDVVTPEKFLYSGILKDTHGNLVEVNGIVELWGTVVSINNNYHCSVKCTELRYDGGKIIFPIKTENYFLTSINFWRGGVDIEEEGFEVSDCLRHI